jgi:hypothetical protein
MRIALALGGLAVASAVLLTWLALEASGVAIVTTRAADGSLRETRVWYVEDAGQLWLEAGAPENGWFRDVQADPRLRLQAPGRSGRFAAEPDRSRPAQRRVRERLRAKYGWRDAWVGLLVDGSQSVAVRLRPLRGS